MRSSAGFYVRSLAHELGARLGCGAHLETLRRVRAGAFDETAAVALAAVEAEGRGASQWIIPIDRLLPDVPAVVLNERGVRRATHGNDVTVEDLMAPSGRPPRRLQPRRRAVSSRRAGASWTRGARSLAIAESRPGGALHPVIVLV